jgi:hypothetical protein
MLTNLDGTFSNAESLTISEQAIGIIASDMRSMEPDHETVKSYAKYLGMSLKRDQEFFYIAREGLMAPLPLQWDVKMDKDGNEYYFNNQTKETSKDHPMDTLYREKF